MVKSNHKYPSSLLAVLLFVALAACQQAPNVGAMQMAVEEDSNNLQDSDPVATNDENKPAPHTDSGSGENPAANGGGTKEILMEKFFAGFEDWFKGNNEPNRFRDALYYGKGSFRAIVDADGRGKLFWAGADGELTLLHIRTPDPACSQRHEVLSVRPDGTIATKVAYTSSQKRYEQKFYPKIAVKKGYQIRIRLAPQDWCKSKLPAGVTWLELSDKYAVIMKVE